MRHVSWKARERFVSCLAPLCFLLFALLFVVIGYTLPGSARAMPTRVAWGTIILALIDLLTRFEGPAASRVRSLLGPSDSPKRDVDRAVSVASRLPFRNPSRDIVSHPIVPISAVILFVALLVSVGLLGAVPILTVCALRFGARWRLWSSLLAATLLTLFIWLVFAQFLQLQLFPGMLFGGNW